MKISVSSYSFSQYIQNGLMKVSDTVKKAYDMGFEAIEFTEMPKDDELSQLEYAKDLKNRADALGMKINSYTIGATMYQESESDWQAEFDRLKGQIEIAAALGVECMRHDVCYRLTEKGRSFGMMLDNIAEHTRALTEFAASYNIQTCSENHGFIAQDSYRMEQLFNAVNHENYGLLVDFGNFKCVDEDSITAVSRLAPYAIHAHAKDMRVRKDGLDTKGLMLTRGGNRLECVAIGEGDVPVLQCMKIMKRAGYKGYLSIEYEGKGDCIEGIKKGKKNLECYINQIGHIEAI